MIVVKKLFSNKENKIRKNKYIDNLGSGDRSMGRKILKATGRDDFLESRAEDIRKGVKYRRLPVLSPKRAREYFNRYFLRHPNIKRLVKK